MLDFSAYPPLCTQTVLSRYPGGPFAEPEISIASGVVRRACGWHIAPSTSMLLTLDSDGGSLLLLPSLHLTEVAEVRNTITGAPIEGFRFSSAGMLELAPPQRFPCGFRSVEVEVTTGLDTVPPELLAVIADICIDLKASAHLPAAVKAMTVGGESFTYDVAGVEAGIGRYEHVLAEFRA